FRVLFWNRPETRVVRPSHRGVRLMALETRDETEAPHRAPPALDFRAVYDTHSRSVRRFLGDLLRDDTAADEATQETFVRAHARLSTLASGDKVLPWLFGIARNV